MLYNIAKEIMKKNFIGYEELSNIAEKLNLSIDNKIKEAILNIPYDEKYLKSVSETHLLILYIPKYKNNKFITLNSLRSNFGINPELKEPCFYNQDWYINEPFANFYFKKTQWFCIRKEVLFDSRGKTANDNLNLPHALVCAYTFFIHYFISNSYLWENDYIWCKDLDTNGDRIYVGRYFDPSGISKNGFSIHRHLSISNMYGSLV
jgi:hypothetical protein